MNYRIKFFLFIGLFLLLRLAFLTSLPIVTDEAQYLHWGTMFLNAWDNPAMPLSLHGKQALTFITAGLVQNLPLDPLIAARSMTILFSLLTVFTLKKNVLAIFLLATSPLFLFFNRLALPDTAVTVSYALAMMLALSKKQTLLKSIAIGFIVAIGWWFKSTALLAIPALLLTLGKNAIIPIVTALLFSLGIIQLVGRVVPLSQTEHVFTVQQLLAFPWQQWISNVIKALQAILLMASPFAVFAFNKKKSAYWSWFLVPVVSEIILTRIFNLRYLILAIPAFTLLIAESLKTKRLLTILIITTNTVLSIILITRPISFFKLLSPLPSVKTDISQYVVGWPSGWGVKEAAEFLEKEAKAGPMTVYVRLDGGNPEDAMYVYLKNNKNIKVLPVNYLADPSPPRSYFVSRGSQYAGLENRLIELARFPKPLDNEFVGVYMIQSGSP